MVSEERKCAKVKRNITEREFIDCIRRRTGEAGQDVIKGIGDDCAVVRGDGKSWLLTTDTLVESVHFDLSWHPSYLLGRKTASVNISDIAAMGGRPLAALLSMAVPDPGAAWLDEFLAGFLAVLKEQGATLIGGDTVRSRAGAVFNVTVLGDAEENTILYRSGATVDDTIWVSGYLGEAAAGLELLRRKQPAGKGSTGRWPRLTGAHLDPHPRTRLGRLLATSGLVHAMMDLSDGLATDLAHMCAASHVGAGIEAVKLPISQDLAAASAYLSVSSLDLALKGGEDYQLLFTVSSANEAALRQLVAENGEGEIFCIGHITEGKGVHLLREDGQLVEITYQGYDHFNTSRKV
jgi:thiamine-monophosphate kinase